MGEEVSPEVSRVSSTASAWVPLPDLDLDEKASTPEEPPDASPTAGGGDGGASATTQEVLTVGPGDGHAAAAEAEADRFFGWDSGGESEVDDGEELKAWPSIVAAEGTRSRFQMGSDGFRGLAGAAAGHVEGADPLMSAAALTKRFTADTSSPRYLRRRVAAASEHSFERLGPRRPSTVLKGRPGSARRSPRPSRTAPADAAQVVPTPTADAKAAHPRVAAAGPHPPIMRPMGAPAPFTGRSFRRCTVAPAGPQTTPRSTSGGRPHTSPTLAGAQQQQQHAMAAGCARPGGVGGSGHGSTLADFELQPVASRTGVGRLADR